MLPTSLPFGSFAFFFSTPPLKLIQTITFGGSYPGELAAFLRIAYPDEILGALAASAPLRYHQGFNPPVPNGAFFQKVTQDMAVVDSTCPALVQKAFTELYMLAQTADGRTEASAKLRLCTPFTDNTTSLRWVGFGRALSSQTDVMMSSTAW